MPSPRRSFYETIAAAIKDVTDHGFDSEGRIDFWTQQIREAAEREAKAPHLMEAMLKEGLGALYRRLVERGEIARHHPGIERFTLERIKPHLRAELDRRILASASLIKDNRKEAIEKTLSRFRGWSTSIPKGGSKAVEKGKTKDNIKKALTQLPFEERRVLIDQGYKLQASISDILAKDGAAIAARWRSHWRQAGYDYREDHKERDNHIYALRGNWASAAGLMKPGPDGYYDEITSAGQEPFCRCYIQYIYNLRDLPPSMLTKKGKDRLAEVRAVINRADSEERDDGIMDYVTANNVRAAISLAIIGLVSHVGQAQGPEFENAVEHTVHNIADLAGITFAQARVMVRKALHAARLDSELVHAA